MASFFYFFFYFFVHGADRLGLYLSHFVEIQLLTNTLCWICGSICEVLLSPPYLRSCCFLCQATALVGLVAPLVKLVNNKK